MAVVVVLMLAGVVGQRMMTAEYITINSLTKRRQERKTRRRKIAEYYKNTRGIGFNLRGWSFNSTAHIMTMLKERPGKQGSPSLAFWVGMVRPKVYATFCVCLCGTCQGPTTT